MVRPIHPDFQFVLDLKSQEVIDLFSDARQYMLELAPDCNELVYHTHALTSVFSFPINSPMRFVCYPFTPIM